MKLILKNINRFGGLYTSIAVIGKTNHVCNFQSCMFGDIQLCNMFFLNSFGAAVFHVTELIYISHWIFDVFDISITASVCNIFPIWNRIR